MKITYEIKTIKDFKEIPMISKIGISLFMISVLSGLIIGLLIILNIQIENVTLKDDYIFYCVGTAFVGLFIAILFDKGRKRRTKVGIKGPN